MPCSFVSCFYSPNAALSQTHTAPFDSRSSDAGTKGEEGSRIVRWSASRLWSPLTSSSGKPASKRSGNPIVRPWVH